jgi:hypothetical protein
MDLEDFLEALHIAILNSADARSKELGEKYGSVEIPPDEIKEVIDANDIVIGVYPNASEPYGFGFCMIKGECFFKALPNKTKKSIEFCVTGFPCPSSEYTQIARRTFGDRKETEWHEH